jgi:serine protease Do
VVKIVGSVGDRELGGGSGFVISPSGLVVTNDHVFQGIQGSGALECQVHFDNGEVFRVRPLASDIEADIAIGIIDAPPGKMFPFIPLGSSTALQRGETIAVLGAPLGGALVPAVGACGGTRHVADDPIMNAAMRSRADWQLLQVDSAMASGSSGGPIIDSSGAVVGISVLVQTAGQAGVGNLAFGVAMEQAEPIIRSLLAHGRVTRPTTGMKIVRINALMAQREAEARGISLLPPGRSGPTKGGMPTYASPTGLLVAALQEGLPAARAGIRPGDVLLDVTTADLGKVDLVHSGDYFRALGPVYQPGRTLVCTVWRPSTVRGGGGSLLTVTIVPEKRTEVPVVGRRF